MDALLPALPSLLVALQVWVMGDEYPRLGLLVRWQGGGVGGITPGEVEYVRFEVLPAYAQIFRHIQLFVNFAWLAISKVGATRPAGCQGPIPLLGVESELVNALARVQSPEVGSAVLGDPIDSVTSRKNHQAVVNWRLNHFPDLADIGLPFLEH